MNFKPNQNLLKLQHDEGVDIVKRSPTGIGFCIEGNHKFGFASFPISQEIVKQIFEENGKIWNWEESNI